MRVFSLLLLALFFFACKDDDQPGEVLPAEKMEQVLWDLLQADEYAQQKFPEDSSARSRLLLEHYQQVFAINRVSAASFKKSYNWYSAHPGKLNVVLDSLRNRSATPIDATPTPRPRKRITDLVK
jgi:hypothetical protein